MRCREAFKRSIWAAVAVGGLYCVVTIYRMLSERDLAERCRLAAEAGHWAVLGETAARWHRLNPKNVESILYLADAAERREAPSSAVDYLGLVPLDDKRAAAAIERRMKLLFEPLNKPRAAARECERLLELDPANNIARQRLVFFLAMTFQRVELIRRVREGFARGSFDRQDCVYLFLASDLRFSNGPQVCGRWSLSDPNDELFVVARAMQFSSGLNGGIPSDRPEVVERLRAERLRRDATLAELLERYPRNMEVLAFHLQRAATDGDVEQMSELMSQAPESAELDFRFWRFKGWLHTLRDELDAADRAFDAALALHPIDWTTRHQRVSVWRRLGRSGRPGQTDDVEQQQKLAKQGRELYRRLLTVKDAGAVDGPLLREMSEYAAGCGDLSFAEALARVGSSDGRNSFRHE